MYPHVRQFETRALEREAEAQLARASYDRFGSTPDGEDASRLGPGPRHRPHGAPAARGLPGLTQSCSAAASS